MRISSWGLKCKNLTQDDHKSSNDDGVIVKRSLRHWAYDISVVYEFEFATFYDFLRAHLIK